MAQKIIAAFASDAPGDLDSPAFPHFGRSPFFVLVTLDTDANILSSETIRNPGHAGGGCGFPVNTLADMGAIAIICGSMGIGPLQTAEARGVRVFQASGEHTVRFLLEEFMDGKLQEMTAPTANPRP